jgi:hypothetical protein
MRKLTEAKVIAGAAVIGLAGAGLTFGDSLMRFVNGSGNENAPLNQQVAVAPEPSQLNVQTSGTQHVVVHQSGTDRVLTGEDHLVITADMMRRPIGAARAEFDADDGDRPSAHCAPFDLRIQNSTDATVHAKVGVDATDNEWAVGIGPGERYVAEDLAPGIYFAIDRDLRWYEKFPVDHC